MTRFVQPAPQLADPYRSDLFLPGWLDHLLGPDGHAAARDRLAALAADVLGPLREAHDDAEADPPRLDRYDGWGRRVDRVRTAPGWETLRRAAATHALVALPYLPEARRTWGAGARTLQHALLHLYAPESATFTCPVAMADGAAALLSRPDVDPGPGDWLARLVSTDPARAVTSGQWMTESTGGSHLGGAATVATPTDGGSWRLTGEKWFCSAIDSALAVALARPAGATGGSRSLAPFLVVRDQPGVRLHRLKDKLGTRAVPTAEVALRDAEATPVGDPGHGGLARMMTLVVVTRLHNAAAAAAGMARGLAYARDYAARRAVAGHLLGDHPLHRATLGVVEVDAAGCYALTAHAFALLGRVETLGDPVAADRLRLVAPIVKLLTAKLAVAAASELLEAFGGAGYVEDTGLPRLLRDAQVLPIWEGTTNVLALDVLRALHRGEGLDAVPAVVRDEATAAAADPRSPQVLAGARGLAMRIGTAITADLLDDHAATTGAGRAATHATLWRRRHLAGADVSAPAAAL
jgi:alkylation response protein AidB-like acyl-CoA dehydrogenase